MDYQPIPDRLDAIGKEIVDSAYHVHKQMGPGLIESVYEECIIYHLRKKGMHVDTQRQVPIHFDGVQLKNRLRLDVLVENSVIIENKAVEKMKKLYEAQLMTYLRLSGLRLGYLINYNVQLIKNGIRRIVI